MNLIKIGQNLNLASPKHFAPVQGRNQDFAKGGLENGKFL